MNNHLSLRRMLLYARKHYIENARHYLYLFGTVTLLLAVSLWYFEIHIPKSGISAVISVMLLLIATCDAAYISCRDQLHPLSVLRSRTLPVTAAEQYLFSWFNTTVLATGIFVLIQWLPAAIVECPRLLQMPYPTWLLIYFIQAALLLACNWARTNPLKVFLPLIAGYVLFFILYYKIVRIGAGLLVTLPFSTASSIHHSSSAMLMSYPVGEQLSSNAAHTLLFGFWIVVCWIVGYFKCRERTLK